MRCSSATLDVSDRDAIARLVESVSAGFGALDVLVHNAAYFPLRPLRPSKPKCSSGRLR